MITITREIYVSTKIIPIIIYILSTYTYRYNTIVIIVTIINNNTKKKINKSIFNLPYPFILFSFR